jgi:uncharacterized protein (DUF2147 family)
VLPRWHACAENGSDAILGIWHTTDDKSQVKISKRNNHYFGEVVSLTQPNWPDDDKLGMGGKPRTDRNNPDPKLRDRPIAGLQVMNDFVYAGKNLWNDGKIYDPELGKTYKCKMTLVSTNKLEVRGFIGFSLLGRTVVWTR